MSLASRPLPAFYQMRRFESLETRTVFKNARYQPSLISPKSRESFAQVAWYFDELTFRRVGILRGEYLLINDVILIDQEGSCIKANMCWEDPFACRGVDDFCATPEFLDYRRKILASWHLYPVAHATPLLSNPYIQNYYHFTLETAPMMRFFQDASQIVVPERGMEREFQRSLLGNVVGGKTIAVASSTPIKLVDPKLAYEPMSEEGIHWLRDASGLRIQPGDRRIYLARSTRGTRSGGGGGLALTSELEHFLGKHGFEIVDFGTRDLTVAEQVAALSGAGVVLAPHGAALTNLVHAGLPMKLIEVVGARTARAVFMHLALTVGIDYRGVFCGSYDDSGNLVVDVDELEYAMAH